MKSTIWRRFGALLATAGLTGSLLATVAAPLAPVALAAATDPACAALGGDDLGLGTECVISTFQAHTGTFNLGEGLRITGNGRLDTSGGAFTLNLCVAPAPVSATCDLKLETPIALTGGQIEAQDTGASGNSGSPIVINASRNVVMQAGCAILVRQHQRRRRRRQHHDHRRRGHDDVRRRPAPSPAAAQPGANPGALISAQKLAGAHRRSAASSRSRSGAGDHHRQLLHGGRRRPTYGPRRARRSSPTAPPASRAHHDHRRARPTSPSPARSIEAGGPARGTATQHRRQDLRRLRLRADQPRAGSRARAPTPGADLIHLESCDVLIRGLVESTGKGHTADAANSCDNVDDGLPGEVFRAGKPAYTTGCIEVWGKLVTIDSSNAPAGPVSSTPTSVTAAPAARPGSTSSPSRS